MHIHDIFEDRAKAGDSGFAIAFAILELADQTKACAAALDRLGTNNFSPKLGPGTTEFIGMQLERIAAALEVRP